MGGLMHLLECNFIDAEQQPSPSREAALAALRDALRMEPGSVDNDSGLRSPLPPFQVFCCQQFVAARTPRLRAPLLWSPTCSPAGDISRAGWHCPTCDFFVGWSTVLAQARFEVSAEFLQEQGSCLAHRTHSAHYVVEHVSRACWRISCDA